MLFGSHESRQTSTIKTRNYFLLDILFLTESYFQVTASTKYFELFVICLLFCHHHVSHLIFRKKFPFVISSAPYSQNQTPIIANSSVPKFESFVRKDAIIVISKL